MKKILSLILAIILCFGCFSIAGSAAFTKGVLTYEINSDGEAFVTACNKNASGVVVVPSVVSINGGTYSVVGINDIAFENCVKVTEVSIAEGITTIGSRAFAGCTALTDVYVPESLLFCQYTAFSGCSGLTIHCYSSNYQLFTVYGFNTNLKIDILSSEEDSSMGGEDPALTNSIISIIRAILLMILQYITNGFAKN